MPAFDWTEKELGFKVTIAKGAKVATLEQYIAAVDAAVQKVVGLSVHDLADWDFAGAWEDETPAKETAAEILADNGWDG